ncbi:MAG: YraN family protein [Verrucomicrobiota bacterium]|nr:YraN family protein [Verrucomicrobiota bacterium]
MFSWLKQLFLSNGVASSTGVLGERAAADFLRRERGFTIVARNWRSPRDRRDEIDLVCRDGGTLAFIEVKTRSAGALVPGYEAVGPRKKKILRRACSAYLRALPAAARPVTFRFDIVEVATHSDGTAPEIRHFENVPLFSKSYFG